MSDETRDELSTATFVRGLTIGALLGAVIAGSSIWSRRKARALSGRHHAARHAVHAEMEPGHDEPAGATTADVQPSA